MEEMTVHFEFRECVSLLKSTGKKAGDLRELRDAIAVVSGRSIFHHTYEYFLKGHVLEHTSDFAHWAAESLEERVLAEHLSNIDPYDFKDISGLRGKLLGVIDDYLGRFPEPRKAMPGEEFFFNETITFVFPAGISAKNLAEFFIAIKYLDANSIYYHFFEARTRLGGDDFSNWIENILGKKELAERIRAIDPFMHNIEGIRGHIVEIVELEVKRSMETLAGGGT